MKTETLIKAKFYGYCNTCQFSIFRGETIRYNGLARHVDCEKALTDKAPRKLNPAYVKLIGQVNRKKMRELIQQRKGLG